MSAQRLGLTRRPAQRVSLSGRTVTPGNGSAAITYADGHLIFRYQSGEVALIEATPPGDTAHADRKTP